MKVLRVINKYFRAILRKVRYFYNFKFENNR